MATEPRYARWLACAVVTLACGTTQLRPAATPALLGLHRYGGRDTAVALDDDGLEALPATALLLRLQAPWPGDLQVTVASSALPRVAWDDRMRASAAGSFAANVVDAAAAPPVWEVFVSVPTASAFPTALALEVVSVSADPNATGQEKTSAPLALALTEVRRSLAALGYFGITGASVATGVLLEPGDRLTLLASGTVGFGVADNGDPEGSAALDPRDPAPALRHHSLIYRVGGGPWRQAGRAAGALLVRERGELVLGVNDGGPDDNSGEWRVGVLHWEPRDPDPGDTDGDGLSDAAEATLGTNPRVADTDGDGFSDLAETRSYRTDPLSAAGDLTRVIDHVVPGPPLPMPNLWCPGPSTTTDPPPPCMPCAPDVQCDPDGGPCRLTNLCRSPVSGGDDDGDGLSTTMESAFGTDWRRPDTDEDGLDDGFELLRVGTNPFCRDTDRDGRLDDLEIVEGKDPVGGDAGVIFPVQNRCRSEWLTQ
ncbi:MAG: hypothetical protein A2W29_13330 [Gemmatimonadetes bacterium RBG_16_66_8]|nr:MAG: hypothetical protein A2W29_13330 [Gemmatimonadetes bacterium RBG_16_66_8]